MSEPAKPQAIRAIIATPAPEDVESLLARVARRAEERAVQRGAEPPPPGGRAEDGDRWQQQQLWDKAVKRGVPVNDPEVWASVLAPEWGDSAAAAAVRRAEEWVVAHRRPGFPDERFILALLGKPGTAKTCTLGRWVARAEGAALFVTARKVAMTLRNGFSDNEALWETWEAAKYLAIDELGRERVNQDAILELICTRYSAGRSTMLAGNLPAACPKKLDERGAPIANPPACGVCFACRYVDDRVADRMVREQTKALGLPWFATLTGTSQRGSAPRGAR